MKIAVIENEFGAVSIDEALVAENKKIRKELSLRSRQRTAGGRGRGRQPPHTGSCHERVGTKKREAGGAPAAAAAAAQQMQRPSRVHAGRCEPPVSCSLRLVAS